MGNEPSKHHPYLSANSVRLRQDNTQKPSVKNMLILFNVLLLVIVCVSLLWLAFGHHPEKAQLARTTVRGDGFTLSLLFYKNASVQQSRANNYLVMRDDHGQEVMLWATKTDEVLGCGSKPRLDYSPQRTTTVLNGCYEDDYKTFATVVRIDKQNYQVNMTAEKSLPTEDARLIFGSITLAESSQ